MDKNFFVVSVLSSLNTLNTMQTITMYGFRNAPRVWRCSVPLLDWTGDKLTELIQDQALIHPAQKLNARAAQVSAGVARAGRIEAVTELLCGRRPSLLSPFNQARHQSRQCEPCEQGFEVRRRRVGRTASAMLGHASWPRHRDFVCRTVCITIFVVRIEVCYILSSTSIRR